MGLAKNRMMEQADHGYRLDSIAGYVCADCVGDYALAAVVAAEAVVNQCDFCEKRAQDEIAADVDAVLARIGDGIATEYDDAANHLPQDGGDYVFGSTYGIEDILEDEGWEGHPRFRELVLAAFADTIYSSRDPFALSESEALWLSWNEFVETAVSKARFTFALLPDPGNADPGYPVLRGGRMLMHLADLIREYKLYRTWPAEHTWIRVRPVNKTDPDYVTARDLGAPPSHKAQPNRMSPAGIPMFYASDDEATSIEEALGASRSTVEADAIVAQFCTLSEGLVIDLTDLPPTPSLFDTDDHAQRARLGFLNGFADSISKQVRPEDEQQTQYVPTQIVCEFLRHLFQTEGGIRPVGLMFTSSRNRDATNVTYFVGPEDCLEPEDTHEPKRFQLRLLDYKRHVLN